MEPGLVKLDQSLGNVHDREEVLEALRSEWVDLVERERRTVRKTWTSAVASMQTEYLELLNMGA